jgi:hypothetical protein
VVDWQQILRKVVKVIAKEKLELPYISNGSSMQEIAVELKCSVHKVVYWMDRHQIRRRTISQAIYQKHNPNGDPIVTKADAELLGLGGVRAQKLANTRCDWVILIRS